MKDNTEDKFTGWISQGSQRVCACGDGSKAVIIELHYYVVIFPPKFKFRIRNIIVCIRNIIVRIRNIIFRIRNIVVRIRNILLRIRNIKFTFATL